MTKRSLILILAATTALSALALTAARARDIPKVATGFVANILCSETFVSGQQPGRIFRETTAAMPGVSLITWAMDYQRRPRAEGNHGDVARPRPQPRGLPRRSWLLSRSRRCGRRYRGAIDRCQIVAGAVARDRRAFGRHAARSPTCRRARSRFRRARAAAEARDQGDRGAEGWPRRRRTLCRRLRRRYADPRLLRDQIGDVGADRHSRAQGRADARSAGADRGVARRRRSQACDHGRSSVASYRGPGARQFARRPRSDRCWSRSTG